MENFTRKLKMVRLARQERGLSLAQVAAQLRPPRSITFVHRVEVGGSARINRPVAADFARILETDISELFTEVER
jgi:ribosome-binding protein aMBF1 (putative translation factor)